MSYMGFIVQMCFLFLKQNLPKPKLALNAVGGKSCFTLLKHLQ